MREELMSEFITGNAHPKDGKESWHPRLFEDDFLCPRGNPSICTHDSDGHALRKELLPITIIYFYQHDVECLLESLWIPVFTATEYELALVQSINLAEEGVGELKVHTRVERNLYVLFLKIGELATVRVCGMNLTQKGFSGTYGLAAVIAYVKKGVVKRNTRELGII